MKHALLAFTIISVGCSNPDCGDVIVVSTFPHFANAAMCADVHAEPRLHNGILSCSCAKGTKDETK